MARSRPPNRAAMSPLWVISLFVSLTETVLGVATTRVSGNAQLALIIFVIVFPVLIAGAFFAVLWKKPGVLYTPSDFVQTDVQKFFDATTGRPPLVTKTSDLKGKVSIFGRPDRFKLLFKATGEGWIRSTKAMEVPGGCLVQVSTSFLDSIGESGAEAL